jgi:hypothetical protein
MLESITSCVCGCAPDDAGSNQAMHEEGVVCERPQGFAHFTLSRMSGEDHLQSLIVVVPVEQHACLGTV